MSWYNTPQDWEWTETTHQPKVTNYRIVSGMPDYVDRHVQDMINAGWELNGSLMIMRVDGKDIIIQGMVKYKEDK